MELTGPGRRMKEKHGANTAPVERLVMRYLFLSQELALSATKSDYFSRLRSASVLPFFYLIRQTINIFSQ